MKRFKLFELCNLFVIFFSLFFSFFLFSQEGVSLETPYIEEELTALNQNILREQSLTLPPPFSAIEAVEILPKPPLGLPEGRYRYPSVAVVLSALFPGLGHVYLQDMSTASALVGSSAASLTTLYASRNFDVYGLEALATVWMYGLYAAYRDARLFNLSLYDRYPMPKDSFMDLTLAPFKWSIMKKTEVWGGVLGAFLLAVSMILIKDSWSPFLDKSQSTNKNSLYPLLALPTGISEEALFRGFLQSQFTEWSNPIGGILGSSLLFGACHISNASSMPLNKRLNYYTFSIPFITLIGMYEGWLTYKNTSLQESVAMHTWYDFILMALGTWTRETASLGYCSFSISIPF